MGISVDLAMSVVSGVIKLGGRIDKVLAENRAVQDDFTLPEFYNTNKTNAEMNKAAQSIIVGIFDNDTNGQPYTIQTIMGWSNNQLAANAERVQSEISIHYLVALLNLLKAVDPQPGAYADLVEEDEAFEGLFGDWFFQQYIEPTNPNVLLAAQIQAFKQHRKIAVDDDDIYRTSLMISAGKVTQSSSAWRIAMATLDVFGELTLENQQSLIKDEKKRTIVASVLTYFTKGDLEDDIQSPGSLFKRVLSATLNGLLDTKETWQGNDKWLNSLLQALTDARTSVDEDKQVDYLVGLLSGEGYNRLVGELIDEAGDFLEAEDDGDKKSFKTVIAQMLSKTAEYYKNGPEGGDFSFAKKHWADIARAGLKSFSTHSDGLLSGNSELMKTILTSATSVLGSRSGDFTGDDLTATTEGIIQAVSDNPNLINDQQWMGTVFISFADIVENVGLKKAFTKSGLEQFTRTTLRAVAEHPVLIERNGKFVNEFIKDLLTDLSESKSVTAQSLATVVLSSALDVVSDRPELVKRDSSISPVIGSFAAELGKLIDNKAITRIQGQNLLQAGTRAIAANPELLIKAQNKVTQKFAQGNF